VGTFGSISLVVSAVVVSMVASLGVASVVMVSVVNAVVDAVVVVSVVASVVVVSVVVSGIFVVVSCIIGDVSWGPTVICLSVVDEVIFVVALHLRLQIHGLTSLQLQLNGPLLQLEPQLE